ncbi:MAG: hypothetical protein KY468_11495 [Armatimonadetes bacterium]|nr:hypothetical protein [Armatimonadota bacterium]
MAEPWFTDVNAFGAWYGAVVGGVGGMLLGVLGGLAGMLAPQGKGRAWILGGWLAFFVFGVINLLVGLLALADRQPYAIWYPFLLIGLILTGVTGAMYPVLRRRYMEAEARRVEAAALRKQ